MLGEGKLRAGGDCSVAGCSFEDMKSCSALVAVLIEEAVGAGICLCSLSELCEDCKCDASCVGFRADVARIADNPPRSPRKLLDMTGSVKCHASSHEVVVMLVYVSGENVV